MWQPVGGAELEKVFKLVDLRPLGEPGSAYSPHNRLSKATKAERIPVLEREKPDLDIRGRRRRRC
jgi:hypothetical protein